MDVRTDVINYMVENKDGWQEIIVNLLIAAYGKYADFASKVLEEELVGLKKQVKDAIDSTSGEINIDKSIKATRNIEGTDYSIWSVDNPTEGEKAGVKFRKVPEDEKIIGGTYEILTNKVLKFMFESLENAEVFEKGKTNEMMDKIKPGLSKDEKKKLIDLYPKFEPEKKEPEPEKKEPEPEKKEDGLRQGKAFSMDDFRAAKGYKGPVRVGRLRHGRGGKRRRSRKRKSRKRRKTRRKRRKSRRKSRRRKRRTKRRR